MYQIAIQNATGDRLELTENKDYIVTASGLSPENANIVTTTVANMPGAKYISSKKQKRNIVLMIYPQRDIETSRINLYKYISTGAWIRALFKNGTRNVYIDGYVESFETDLFARTQVAQVSILCPAPAFIDAQEMTVVNSVSTPKFSFPFYTLIASNLVPGGAGLDDIRCELINMTDTTLILNSDKLEESTLG